MQPAPGDMPGARLADGADALPDAITTFQEDEQPVYRSMAMDTMASGPYSGPGLAMPPTLNPGAKGSLMPPSLSSMKTKQQPALNSAQYFLADGSFSTPNEEPIPHDLPAQPFKLEQTHFDLSTSVDLADISTQISEILKIQGVDFGFKASKCRWKCTSYLPTPVVCKLRIWKRADLSLTLEAQRRSGDCIVFSKLYKEFTTEMARLGFCSDQSQLPKGAEGYDHIKLNATKDEFDAKTAIFNLARMVKSGHLDVQLEGARRLVVMSAQEAFSKSCSECEDILGQMIDALDSKDEELRRCAATILGNLAQSDIVAPQLKLKLDTLISLAAGQQVDLETRRQCYRVLSMLKEADTEVLYRARENPVINELLNAPPSSITDTTLRRYAAELSA